MPFIFKRNGVIVFGLAVLLHWAFLFAKHDAALRSIIPFGEDPYDAVGSFGTLAGMLIAAVSLVRAFRPYHGIPPSTRQTMYLVRAQAAVALVVLITIAADAVAMARHPGMWVGAASRYELVGLLGGQGLVAVVVLLVIRASRETIREDGAPRWTPAVITSLCALLILAIYPEELVGRTATHLFTVIVGALVLFAPMRPLLTALVPYAPPEKPAGVTPARSQYLVRCGTSWGIVVLLGAMIGILLFGAEMTEGGGALPPIGQLVFVGSVYTGLAIAGLVTAYAFLGSPLGL